MMQETYEAFKSRYYDLLKKKMNIAKDSGFEVSPDELSGVLKPHQKDAVCWAVKGGRRGLFGAFGLGKTVMALEFCRIIQKHKGGKTLIVLPLGVKQEFVHDAVTLLKIHKPQYVTCMAEINAVADDEVILLTNYERVRDGDIDPRAFTACVLDEASILRSGATKTYHEFVKKFAGVPFKLVCTATPSPNEYIEIIRYSAFLEILDVSQAKTRFFKRDSTKADNLTLYPHKEREFWLWISSWALFFTKPSDINPDYSDDGYVMPPFEVRYHRLESDNSKAGSDRDGQMMLFDEASLSLPNASREKKNSLDIRIAETKRIVENSPNEHFILWHDREDERHALKKAFPNVSEIYGNLDIEEKEKRVIDFSEGRTRLLATKKEISGSGCNFQKFCHRAIFVGIDYKFNDFIQAIHRIYRFGQAEKVIIDVIYTSNEDEIKKRLLEKWEQHNKLVANMTAIMRDYGLSNLSIAEKLERTMGCERTVHSGKNYTIYNNDCVLEMHSLPENSVDCIITSIPFGNHYEYSPSYNDFGCNEDTDEFMKQMDITLPDWLRVLRPGRICAVHVKDRILFGAATGTGMPTVEPFHMVTAKAYINAGFAYIGMITVATDVVRENNQTYRLGYTEMCKDGTKMSVGCPEYILLFRKLPSDTSNAYADVPVTKEKSEYSLAKWQLDAHAVWRSSGDRFLTKAEIKAYDPYKLQQELQKKYWKWSADHIYSFDEHVKLSEDLDDCSALSKNYMVVAPASTRPDIWTDVVRMRTLNTTQALRKHEQHICPLPFDIVERLINRYTNKGETILDPFCGIGTVPYCSLKLDRRGIGIELCKLYADTAVGYCSEIEESKNDPDIPTLFNLEITKEYNDEEEKHNDF